MKKLKSKYVSLKTLRERDAETPAPTGSADERFTKNQIEVLETLHHTQFRSSCPQEWNAPIDLGGSNGSHHYASLLAMQKRGYVQSKFRGGDNPPWGENGKRIWRSRGSKIYRLTPEGKALVEGWLDGSLRR